MKKLLYIFILLILTSTAYSQNELVNVFNSYSEVYGGMEDSGIQRNESYVFVAHASIELVNISFNGSALKLKNGDSLIINVAKYIPYNSIPGDTSGNAIKSDRSQITTQQITASLIGNRYYVNLPYQYFWQKLVDYIYKKKVYSCVIIEGFDSGHTDYAP